MVTEHLAQRDDLHLQVVLLDDEAGPHDVKELVLGHRSIASFDERQQGVEGAAAELHRHVVRCEQPCIRIQPERREDVDRAGRHDEGSGRNAPDGMGPGRTANADIAAFKHS